MKDSLLITFRIKCMICALRESQFINPFNTKHICYNCDINGFNIDGWDIGDHLSIYYLDWCKLYRRKIFLKKVK